MKILIVNKFLFPHGGAETYIFKLGKAFEDKGNEVQYFGMEHPERIVGNHAESYTAFMDFHKGNLQKLIYPFKIIYSREARIKIRKVLDDFQPDVVHLNNFNFQITPSVIYEIRKWGKRNNRYIPIVYTAHDYQWVCPNHMMYIPERQERCFRCQGGRFENCARNKCIHNSKAKSMIGMLEAKLYHYLKTYDMVDAVICPSKFMRDKLATDGILKKKLQVIYNFLDEGEKIETGKEDYVLYFGRYTEEKGILTLVEACRRLPHIHFIFAGAGGSEKALAGCRNIENVGFKTGEGLKKLIVGARFSVFPSEWYENCPFSVMESQFFGTPVVASDIGGVPELLEVGATGELFAPGNVEELKSKIDGLWNDREKLAIYTENCRKKKFLTASEYKELLMDIFKDLKNGR